MKKWKILLITIACFFSYYISYKVLELSLMDENTILALNFISLIIPVPIYFIGKIIIKKKRESDNKTVSNVSAKIKQINLLLAEYHFSKINYPDRTIEEQEYSRKTFNKANAKMIVFYHFDNNVNDILDDVKNAYENKQKYDNFILKLQDIEIETPAEIIEQTNFTKKTFTKIENRIITDIINDESYYNISIYLTISYIKQTGQSDIYKNEIIEFEELFEFYDEWKNGKKYATNIKVERANMNDHIRYNVLKRDHFTCQICGVTAKDGAKLHVDHIIPLSNGGKTVMSNLQTLCERCNMGKSNKTENDFQNNMLCPNCGAKLIERIGKYGKFVGCSNYPKCNYTRNNKNKKNYHNYTKTSHR